ncbi:BrnT family toxin [Scytonema hofmannii]
MFSGFEARVIVIVHTERDNVIRIISARKATKNEEIRYFQQIAD